MSNTTLELSNGQQALVIGGLIVILAAAYLLVFLITRSPDDIRKMLDECQDYN